MPIELGFMSRETVRRCITFLLIAIIGTVAIRGGEGKDMALTLSPIAALLLPVLRFYFRVDVKKLPRSAR